MVKYKVIFQPDNKILEVEEGITILQAAEQANIYINNLCGGEGLCGNCKVKVYKGNTHTNIHANKLLSTEENHNGFVLACQTTVNDNLEILIPLRSRIEEEKIITEGSYITYDQHDNNLSEYNKRIVSLTVRPLVNKYFLELSPPTLEDNISDIDRIIRELRKKIKLKDCEVTLSSIRNLPNILRENEWRLTISLTKYKSNYKVIQIEPGNTLKSNYGLAIDVGTTTIVVQLVDLNTGKVLGSEGNHNLQARYGEDVVSRMVFACGRGSKEKLHETVIYDINSLTKMLAKKKKIDTNHITSAVVAGNTVMSHFFLSLSPCYVRLEPYIPSTNVYPRISAKDIGLNINREGIIEVLPSVSSYVGGDIIAGILYCGLAEREEITCLIDVGTNGEIVIGNNEWMVCCSASAGPAFEGAGMKHGMRATKGAIEAIVIEKGQVKYTTVGNVKPVGICGSGLIDILFELYINRLIGPDGKFNLSNTDNRLILNKIEPQYIVAYPDETGDGQEIAITESDIANLIKSKGAVFAAVKSLLDYIGMQFEQLHSIYIAGGFGNSIRIEKAIAIGLIPDIEIHRIKFIGNSSVAGARLALINSTKLEKAVKISRKMTNIELSTYPSYMNEFVAALFLPHTDRRLFPHVKLKD